MRFISITIREGIFERTFDFTEKVNLIYSTENTRGKTTLLRFMLYSLGYPIPNTRNIKFEKCGVEARIECQLGFVKLIRNNEYSIELEVDNERTTYLLPTEQYLLQGRIFSTNNRSILSNILGAFYLDQEKGWTLLNRGKVIGGISFNIEELIRGLSNRDCDSLLEELKKLENEKKKYRQLMNVAQFRKDIIEENGGLIEDNYSEQENVQIEALSIEQTDLLKEIERIDTSLKENKSFKNYISSMKIYVKCCNGEEVLVTPDNIVGFADLTDILEARKQLLLCNLARIKRQLESHSKKRKLESEQLSFYSSESMLDVAGRKIAKVPLDAIAIQRIIDNLEKRIKNLKQQIVESTKRNNDVVSHIYDIIKKYGEELNLTQEKEFQELYLFTSNLKELSGAVLHKTVFAFRLAYIIAIENVLGIKLPIILDSPSGKEVDPQNIAIMLNILKRDFSKNQIIIASIFDYDFDSINRIELKNRLLE